MLCVRVVFFGVLCGCVAFSCYVLVLCGCVACSCDVCRVLMLPFGVAFSCCDLVLFSEL